MKKHVVIISLIALVLQSFTIQSNPANFFVLKTNLSDDPILQQINNGKLVYNKNCVACHQINGTGIPGAFPPLAKSDYLNANVNRAIKQVIVGSSGPITVNGKKYTVPMPKPNLNDQQIADVLTYIYASWGNNKTVLKSEMVMAMRK